MMDVVYLARARVIEENMGLYELREGEALKIAVKGICNPFTKIPFYLITSYRLRVYKS